MSFLKNPLRLSPPQPLEPPLLSGDTRYDNVLLKRRTTATSYENPLHREYSHSPVGMPPEAGMKLPALRSMVSLLSDRDNGALEVKPLLQYASNAGPALNSGQNSDRSRFLSEFKVTARSASTTITEPTFAKLLTAGCDMKTALEAMDQELSPEDVLGLFRVDLARPPMPEEPIPDPNYQPRPSTVTGKRPADAQHSKKETERRAQHKHYLDLSEIKIPDFFLKLCGWEEPRGSGTKRTPRTKSSVLQAGCLYMWYLSGPALRCLKTLLHNNNCLEEKVQRLEDENCSLRWRCDHLLSGGLIKGEQTNAADREATQQSPILALNGSHYSPTSWAPSLGAFTILEDSGYYVKPGTELSLPSTSSTRVQREFGKRRCLSASSHEGPEHASPPKKRKVNGHFIDKQDGAVRLAFDDDIENSPPDTDSVRDQSKDDSTPTQIYRIRLSSVPSLQSATSSSRDSASVMSTGSSWEHPSPHSTADC